MQSENIFTDKQICIVGTGGFAKEVYYCLADIFAANNITIQDKIVFSDGDNCCIDSYISMEWGVFQYL